MKTEYGIPKEDGLIEQLIERLRDRARSYSPMLPKRTIYWEAADEIERLTALTRPLGEGEDWQSVENAPHAMTVLACRFDDDVGEWIYAAVMSPPSHPFTHWKALPAPPGALRSTPPQAEETELERAAVIAWLKSRTTMVAFEDAIAAIERGEHRVLGRQS